MSQRKRGSLFLLLLLLSFFCRSEVKDYPIELQIIFSPCPCGENVFLFSKDGKNQTLALEDNAPNCNLVPVTPIIMPLCFKEKVFLFDENAILYSLSKDELLKIKEFQEKILGIHSIKDSLFLIFTNKIVDLEGKEFVLPFEAISSFVDKGAVFIFFKTGFVSFDGENISPLVPFEGEGVEGIVSQKNNFVIAKKGTLYFLNKRGKIRRKFITKTTAISLVSFDENVILASKDHFIRVFDKRGNVKWQCRIDGVPTNIIQTPKGFALAMQNGKKVFILDKNKGLEIFSYTIKTGEIISPLTSNDGKLFFYSLSENLEPFLNIVEPDK
jgi:WD40 repeat protein